MDVPRLSVVVPNYNHVAFLRERLDSIFSQTFQRFEVILLDDASTDGSLEMLSEFRNHPKVTALKVRERNSGSPFEQWNEGVALARGEFVWIAESDDVAHPGMAEELIRKLSSNKRIGVAYCQSLNIDSNSEVVGSWLSHTEDLDSEHWRHDFEVSGESEILKFLLFKNTIPNASAVIFRRAVFEAVGRADPDIGNCGDWLLWLKMLLVSDLAFVAEPLNYFRRHPESTIARATRHYSYHYGRMRARYSSVLRRSRDTTEVREIRRLNQRLRIRNGFDLAHVLFSERRYASGAYYFASAFTQKLWESGVDSKNAE